MSSPIRLGALIALVIAIIGGWSGFWFWGANRVEEQLDLALERQAAAGREIACASRQRGGYPFRLEITCDKPVLTVDRKFTPTIFRFEKLLAVTQIWDPGHVILEATGPATMENEAAQRNGRAAWKLLQVSARLSATGLDRTSLVVDDLELTNSQGSTRVRKLEQHARPTGTTGRDVDIASRAEAVEISALRGRMKPFDVDMQGTMREGLRRANVPVLRNWREWQQAGGTFQLAGLKITMGEASLRATGDLKLLAEGQPDGALTVKAVGLDQMFEMAGLSRAMAASAALFGRPDEVDGKRATAFDLKINAGKLGLGPLQIPLPPAF